MSKVRWGVLSTANIGVKHVIPGMQIGEHCEMVGIASRNLDKARMVAAELGMPKAYGSYEELLADDEIEAVYIPLPNHLHVPWSIRALEAGKHVLCEKPIGLSAAEAEELLAVSVKHPHLKAMEAFMYRHHPSGSTPGNSRVRAASAISKRFRPSSPTITMIPPISATWRRSAAAA